MIKTNSNQKVAKEMLKKVLVILYPLLPFISEKI
jgi:valyl-tRNA synthetase